MSNTKDTEQAGRDELRAALARAAEMLPIFGWDDMDDIAESLAEGIARLAGDEEDPGAFNDPHDISPGEQREIDEAERDENTQDLRKAAAEAIRAVGIALMAADPGAPKVGAEDYEDWLTRTIGDEIADYGNNAILTLAMGGE